MAPANKRFRVLVFAKAPRPGEVKTRLVPLLGAEGASALHALFVERTLRLAVDADIGPVDLYAARPDDPFLFDCAQRYRVRLIEQSGAGLGMRMQRALSESLAGSGAAILIGTDCPALAITHLKDATHALHSGHDAVFIPVEDGGYALIGVNRSPPAALFEGITWSTGDVMADTRKRLRECEWKWRELETLWDVDRPADYERLIASGLCAATGTNTGFRRTTSG